MPTSPTAGWQHELRLHSCFRRTNTAPSKIQRTNLLTPDGRADQPLTNWPWQFVRQPSSPNACKFNCGFPGALKSQLSIVKDTIYIYIYIFALTNKNHPFPQWLLHFMLIHSQGSPGLPKAPRSHDFKNLQHVNNEKQQFKNKQTELKRPRPEGP